MISPLWSILRKTQVLTYMTFQDGDCLLRLRGRCHSKGGARENSAARIFLRVEKEPPCGSPYRIREPYRILAEPRAHQAMNGIERVAVVNNTQMQKSRVQNILFFSRFSTHFESFPVWYF